VSPGKSLEGVIAELFWTSLIALILYALSNYAGIECINLPPSLNIEVNPKL
jgi:CDP-diglyceride synthetase